MVWLGLLCKILPWIATLLLANATRLRQYGGISWHPRRIWRQLYRADGSGFRWCQEV
jgi:hypothetical protein